MDLEIIGELRDKVLVERKGFAFFVDIEYENLPDFCDYCKCTGHYSDICKRRPLEKIQGKAKKIHVNKPNEDHRTQKSYVKVGDGNRGKRKEHVENVTTIEEELNKGIPTSSMARENPEIGTIEISNVGYQDVKVNTIVVFDSQDIIILVVGVISDPNDNTHIDNDIRSNSSLETEFVDATQMIEFEPITTRPKNTSIKDTPHDAQRDMVFLHNYWANMEYLDPQKQFFRKPMRDSSQLNPEER